MQAIKQELVELQEHYKSTLGDLKRDAEEGQQKIKQYEDAKAFLADVDRAIEVLDNASLQSKR